MNKELKDYTDTELMEEIEARIANNFIEIQVLVNLFTTAWDAASKYPDLSQKVVDELVKMGKLKKESK